MKKKKICSIKLAIIHSLKVMLITTALIFSTDTNAQNWTLEQCIDTARLHNKNLQMSRNNMEIGEQRQQEAKANLIPKINLNADYKYFIDLPYQFMPQAAFGGPEGKFKEIQMGVPHNIGANIQLAVPLYNPQIYGAIKTTGIAAEMSGLQYKKTAEQVYFEISNLYYNAQILINQQAFLDSNLVNTSKLLKTLELLHSQLMVKKSDVTKVELQQQQLTTQRELVANNYEQVINTLKFMMGIPFEQNIQIEPEVRHNSGTDYPHLSPVDQEIANIQRKLLSSEMHSLKNSRLPSVSLYGSYGQTGYGYDQKPNNFLKFHPLSFVGLQFSVPVFNGTVTRRKINQKSLELQNSQLQIDLVTEQNQMLVENATRKRLVTSQSIENTQAQTALANTVYHQMLLQQKEGTASLTEVLMADNALREAQQSYLSAIIDFLKADLELKKLTGNISSTN